ncbi:MAG: response regulator [Lachnospiraceae bacterium]|nr:response regulator [Lachnospiraceae bacterium]
MYQVLVADDEPIERTVVCRLIQKYFADQLEPVQAANGREAVELFREKNCSIALLDIEMPGINGLEAAARIREKDKVCSIVFLTAFDEFSYARKAIGVKALDYLLKPSAEEELVAVLEEAIRIADEARLAETTARKSTSEDDAGETAAIEEEQPQEHIRINAVQEAILTYIKNHFMDEISLQDAARAMNYSDAYFCKLFKQCFDKSFTTYLAEYRVKKAEEMLQDVTVNIKNIGCDVGYRDSNYFAKVFKRVAGVTPSEYRIQVLRKTEA